MSSEISKSIQFICDEKGLQYDIVMEALQSALGAAYRKDFGNKQQNIQVIFDPETGDMKVWDEKEVVEDIPEETLLHDQEELTRRREEIRKEGRDLSEEEIADLVRFNPKTQIMISQAKEHKKSAKLGEILKINLEVPGDFGRMAAQTAKQVIIQKLREAERSSVFEDFKKQEGHIVQGIVQRRDRHTGGYVIDLGKITGILPQSETVFRERYTLGNKMKFYVSSVALGIRGPEIILSRKDKRMVSFVFEQEIPEITSGEVVIKGIARDPGNRSKVAVATDDESIDPIGSCVGQRGSRITTIIDELAGEKIDVILYNENAADYIKAALSPAKVASVELDEADKQAIVKVESDQFSLAIGRGGQNVRLAAELTGWKIKVVEKDGTQVVTSEDGEVVVEAVPEKAAETQEPTLGTEEVAVEEVKAEETDKPTEPPAEEVVSEEAQKEE